MFSHKKHKKHKNHKKHKKHKKRKIFISDLPFSDTPLHIFLRTCTSVDQLKDFIKAHDKEIIAKWARIVNDKGEVPIFMIYSLPLSHEKQYELQTILLPFIIPESYVPFGPIDEEKILSRYLYLKEEDELTYANIELGVKAVQAARKLFKESSTHAQVNNFPDAERNAVQQKILDRRKEYDEKKTEWDESEKGKNKILTPDEQNIKRLQYSVEFYSENKVANCSELSDAVLYCIYKLNNNKKAAVYFIASDDHVFVIMDADTPHAVICDALAGDVFPASELLIKLKAFYRFRTENSYINFFPYFNPNYHYLKKKFSLDESAVKLDKCIANYVSPCELDDIEYKAEHLNKPVLDGLTPLCSSIEKKDIDMAKLLLSAQANPDIESQGGTRPLIKAAENESTAAIMLLIKAKAHIEFTNQVGETPLILAIEKGNSEAVKILLAEKANANHGRYDDATPLFFVKSRNSKSIVERLIESKADINYKMADGSSPLINSIYVKDVDLLRCLLDKKADPNVPDKKGLTALYLAAEFDLVDHVKLLLQYKADPHIKYKNKSIPLDVAKECKHAQIVKILEKFEEVPMDEMPKPLSWREVLRKIF